MSKSHDRKGSRKGPLKSRPDGFDPIDLHTALITDLIRSGLPLSSRDIVTVKDRYEHEGWKFLSVVLKDLGKCLLTLLESRVMPDHTFKCKPGSTKLPLLFKGLWEILMTDDGHLKNDEYSPRFSEAVRALLQLTMAWSKYEASTPLELKAQYLDEFIDTDSKIPSLSESLRDNEKLSSIISIARSIITRVFDGVDMENIVPRHGPGAVASGEKLEEKWTFSRLFLSLDASYPYHEYHSRWIADWDSLVSELKRVQSLKLEAFPTAKIHVVPKDASSLRIISAEPLEVMFIQQGQMDLLVERIESHPLTKGYVNFSDQEINGRLALEASRHSKGMATLDLSAASDRLSLELVKELFRGNPEFLTFLLASRSECTTLPDGRVHRMRKFAPMGSAVCFPVQSIVFYALCLAAISLQSDIPYQDMLGSVYVYGDDIIVSAHFVWEAIDALESVGLKVNVSKSFFRGFFRESCGVFAFAGREVTPLRFKKRFPASEGDGSGWSAWVKYAHQCELEGYLLTAGTIYSLIEANIGPLPYGTLESSYFCRLARSSPYGLYSLNRAEGFRLRWNIELQCAEIRAKGPRVGLRKAAFPDWWTRLFRSLLTSFQSPETDPDHVVVPNSTKTKLGWHLLR